MARTPTPPTPPQGAAGEQSRTGHDSDGDGDTGIHLRQRATSAFLTAVGRILQRLEARALRNAAVASAALAAHPKRSTPASPLLPPWAHTLLQRARTTGTRRIVLRLVSVMLALGGIIMLMGPDFSPGRFPTLESYLRPAVSPTQDFVLRHFAVDYTLDRDAQGRSSVKVVETVDAVFPQKSAGKGDFHGIERFLPAEFGEQTVRTHVSSITTDTGEPVKYTVDRVGDFWHITTTSATPLTGDHVYLIRYVQTSVTTRDDTSSRDLFRWSMTGDSWLQPMAGADLTVRMSDALATRLVSDPRYGYAWAILDGHDTLERTAGSPGQTVFTGRVASALPAFASVWTELDFRAGTFAAPQWSVLAWARLIAPFVPIILGIMLLIASLAARRTIWRNDPGRGIIIAENEPESGIDLMGAAQILGRGRRGVVSALIDLAVRGNLRLLRIRDHADDSAAPLSTDTTNAPLQHGWYEFDFVSRKGLSANELMLVTSIFGSSAATTRPHTTPVRIAARNTALRARLSSISFAAWRSTLAEGFRSKPVGLVRDLLTWGVVATTALQWGFSRQLAYHATDTQGWLLFCASVASAAVTFTTFALAMSWYPLTRKGAMAREHLLGMREYIRVAEQQRIQFLQSPKGALYASIRKPGKIVQLAELGDPLLPYAILFGQERGWRHSLDLATAGKLPRGWWMPSDITER
jgi:hypothetical protein